MRAAHYSAVLHAIQVTMLIHKQGENPRDNSALAAELVPCVILSEAKNLRICQPVARTSVFEVRGSFL